MVMNASAIQDGMDVFGSDGEKIGSISEVYPDRGAGTGTRTGDLVTEEVPLDRIPGAYGVAETERYASTEIPAAGTVPSTAATATMRATGYFKVKAGGVLGIGAKEFYFPFKAVETIVDGDTVTVNCTKDECDDLYTTKPAFLDED